jgi:hypothetical protein
MIRLISYAVVILLILALALVLIGFPAASIASPDITMTPSSTPVNWEYLPFTSDDATATPVPTPTDTPYSAAAAVEITFGKPINASTYNTGSFRVFNESLNGERLSEVRIDLSTAIFTDMVFDPHGEAGDTVAKDVTVDVSVGLDFDGWTYNSPNGGGYNTLILKFREFDPGDQFAFSVDVDPTSIKGVGAPGPMETGSVGGLELVGAMVTATFDDGTVVLANQTYRTPDDGGAGADHSGAVAVLRPGAPEQPALEVLGATAPATVTNQNQIVRVGGPAGRPVIVLVVEGGQFIEGVPDGGFDLDRYEANSAVTTREYAGVIGPTGTVDIPILLTRTILPGGVAGGFNVITAVFDNHHGLRGEVAAPLVLELQ